MAIDQANFLLCKMEMSRFICRNGRETFRLFLIKPSHYDDNGYVIQWVRSEIPSNTMAALNGTVLEYIARRVLGDNVDVEISAYDETNPNWPPSWHHEIEPVASVSCRNIFAPPFHKLVVR